MTRWTRWERTGLANLVSAALLPLSVQLAQAQPRPAHDFTLEQVLSAPFPSNLTAASRGGRVAWVYDTRGVRNVWVSDSGPDGRYRSRPITAYAGDDGYDLGELSWDGAGRTVVYTRGGSLEGGGPVNIMSLASGPPPQTIWAASVDGGAPRAIGLGHSAAVSPRGDTVAYLLGGQVWTTSLAGGTPSQLIHDRGEASALTWSPDGSRFAFVSSRGDHSLVGVYDVASHAIAWMQPGFDTAGMVGGRSVPRLRARARRRVSLLHRAASGPALVHLGRRSHDGRSAPGLGRRARSRQRLPSRAQRQGPDVDGRRSNRLPLGADRLGAPLRRIGDRRPCARADARSL